MQHEYTDAQIQSAIDAAFPAGARPEGFNLDNRPSSVDWKLEAPNRLAIARAFLAALPERPQAAEIAKFKAALAESEKQFQDKVYEIARLLDECDKAQGILKACLSVTPFGNIETHTFENLPGRIADLASEIASLSLENERLETELAALRTPILADDGRSLGKVLKASFDADTEGLTIDECYEAAAQAVAAVVLVQAVRRMEVVSKEEIWEVFKNDPNPFAQEALEAVRARLVDAAKGEGKPVVANEPPQDEKQPDLSGESEKQDEPAQAHPCVCGSPTTIGTVHRNDGPCYQEPAQPWTPAVGDTVRLKSGGPVMTVMDAEEDGEFWCLWFDPCGNKEGMDFPTACLTPAQP